MKSRAREALGVSLLTALSFAAACASEGDQALTGPERCTASVQRGADGVLQACGEITPDLIASVRRELLATDTQIILTSNGGASTHGIALAELINSHGLAVRVRHMCLSACSTYVLLTARQVVVEPNASVAFHHTAAFAVDFLATRLGRTGDEAWRSPSTEEKSFFAANGLDPDLGNKLTGAVQPTCMGVSRTPGGPTPRAAYIHYRYAWFVPTPEEARNLFRGRLSGYWPGTRQEAQAVLREAVGDSKPEIQFGWPTDLNSDVAWYARELPQCSGPGSGPMPDQDTLS